MDLINRSTKFLLLFSEWLFRKIINLCCTIYAFLKKFAPDTAGGAVFPGDVAHYPGDIGEDFEKFTLECGESSASYFKKSGIKALAISSGGICTFRINGKPAVYQVTNLPLVNDNVLSPSTGPNRSIFGDFMGTYPCDAEERKEKRRPILKNLASQSNIRQFIPEIKSYATQFLLENKNCVIKLEDFAIQLVSYVDSHLSGVVDLRDKPISEYLQSSKYKSVMRDFFELASDVISKLDTDALNDVESVVPFMQDLINCNITSIEKAPETNIIKQYLKTSGITFDSLNVNKIPNALLKELATIIIALYDTTSLSLYWCICYIESNPEIKREVIKNAPQDININQISYIESVVLETIRLAGGNPTALWREVLSPIDVNIDGKKIKLKKGMLIWLDRRHANQDKNVFSCPHAFNPENISHIKKHKDESIFSILANNRYEINSFSMINTFNNPRKCPGRFFSIVMQSCLIREIYGAYQVKTKDVSTDKLRKFCSMPRPDNSAVIELLDM